MENVAHRFEQGRYVVLPGLLNGPLLAFYYQYALRKAESGTMALDDVQAPGTPSAYGDPMMEVLLQKLLPEIEVATGLQLYPTYSYFRVYKRGDVLAKHKDRPACEISMSLNLGSKSDKLWPLWIQTSTGISSVTLDPGDAVLYRGLECPHWREAFEGNHTVQLFLHYVDRNGPNAEWKFDKRKRLSSFHFQGAVQDP